MGVLLADDVGRHRPFKARLPELLEHRRPERRIVEGRRAERDQRVPVGALEACDVGVRDPQGQEPQDPAGLLEAWQRLLTCLPIFGPTEA